MSKIRVAVLRGGSSPAYDDSLKTGAYVLSLLREMPEEYEPVDIFISRDGSWHHAGLPEEPHRILSRADIVWNVTHGPHFAKDSRGKPYGEGRQVEQLMEVLKVPFVGSGTLASSFARNKEIAKIFYLKNSFLTPESTVVTEADLFNEERLMHTFRNYLHPVIVKPATGVGAIGVRLAHTFQELRDAVKRTLEYSSKAMVEEYVRGAVVSSTIVEGARGEELYAFTPVHLAPPVSRRGKEVARKRTTPKREENKIVEEMARTAHRALGLRHYSSSDFIVTPKGKIYILETNSSPALHENSLTHHSLKQSGWKPRDFADHCLKLALNRLS